MRDPLSLPKELAFLLPHIQGAGPRYRKASWLRVPFEADIWIIETDCRTVIDWRVPVGHSRRLLTSPYHSRVLEVFKSLLILQTHVDTTGGIALSATTQHRRLHVALDCIDYFLINADRLGITESGLECLSESEYCSSLAQILSHPWSTYSVYRWNFRIAEYLRANMVAIDAIDIANALERHQFLGRDIPDIQERVTDLTEVEIIQARVWLWLNARYSQRRGTQAGFQYVPDFARITSEIYRNTLGGKTGWTTIPELGLVPGYRVHFERARAPITDDPHNCLTPKRVRTYCATLLSLETLRESGLPISTVPRVALQNLASSINTESTGRFRTLRQDVVFFALRNALEFCIKHGEHLLESFVNIAIAARDARLSINVFAEKFGISSQLATQTVEFGVRSWTIEPCYAGSGVMRYSPKKLSGQQYFQALRNNHGLHELLLVLYGAIQVAVATLTARRQGELNDLISGRCLDYSRTSMIFDLRKSGVAGRRQRVHRAIPPVVATLLGLVERMQDRLVSNGIIEARTNLFASPAQRGKVALGKLIPMRYNEAIDYFCDYVETPTNELEQRFYLRTHQLRRFFCLLFFWGAGFGGVDALRYHLGHTNNEHLWHYITESVPGEVLRGVKAEWAATNLKEGRIEEQRFADLIEAQFGTRDFNLLNSDVLALHIEDLIHAGEVAIEPVFLDAGQSYQIAVLVKPTKT
ncbi:hypothetical protein ACQQ2N_06870 [Dokdonella sp. MW10]|uniref:hypothetical protein n=1 Tax=Dokdonella sp. MW10 TaxID=2992926 RepID=UPI003F7FEBAF